MRWLRLSLLVLAACQVTGSAAAQVQEGVTIQERNDSVSIRFTDVDLRLALQALGRYLDRPIIFGELGPQRVTVETSAPLPRERIPTLLEGILAAHGLEMIVAPEYYRIGSEPAASVEPQELQEGASLPQLFVITIIHARAIDVAATVNALFGRGGALGEPGSGSGTLAQGLADNLVPPVGDEVPQEARPISQQVAQLAGDVTIIPDQSSNSLLVRASQRDFDLIYAAVTQLDVRPLQVLIEVIIAEVRRDKNLGIGVETILPRQPLEGDSEIAGSIAGLGLGDLIIDVIRFGSLDLSATLALAASRGEVEILSRPVVLAANNETAEILVGSQRPFIQVQRALPTDAPVRDQVVQFKDVGTRLAVTPTISDDGYVMLEVAQEVNAATTEIAFDAPVISTRAIQTQLLVMDGHTAILGGLTDVQRDMSRQGVPILSGIPLLGGLFGRQVERRSETELFVFLTPRVIRSDEDLDAAGRGAGNRTRRLLETVMPDTFAVPPPMLPDSTTLQQGRR
jgi:general secretion pathway protein D